jgi:hypothetical protein
VVYLGGRYDNEGRKRRTEEELMTMDVDNALKDSQAGAEDAKPKRTTRSGAKAKAVGACPNPTHDGMETVLPNGDPVVPPGKAKGKKKARVTSKAYIDVSGDEAAPPSSTVVPAKTRVKSRAAKKAVVGPSDDEDESIELPKDAEDSGMVGKGKRKQQDNADNADDGASTEHQPKRPRPTPRQASITDVDALEGDTLEGDMFNRASARGARRQTGGGECPFIVDDACIANQLSISQPETPTLLVGGLPHLAMRGLSKSTVRFSKSRCEGSLH